MNIGNVLSLFDGMSCGQIALNNLGIKYDNGLQLYEGRYLKTKF